MFAPITAALAGHLSWRVTYLVLAAILAAVTIPLHALALRHPWPPASHAPAEPSGAVLPGQPARTRPFVLLAAAFTLSSFAMYAVVFGLIPLLTERGASPTTSAWALGLGGLGQTLGRTLYAAIARRTPPATRTAALIASGGVTTALLALVPGPVSLLVILAVLAGTVRGNLTLLQATAVTDRWGTAAYGHLSALLAAPSTTAAALAPWAVAALAPANGGHPALFAVLAALSAAAAALALRTAPPRRRGSAGPMRPAVAQRRVLPAQAGSISRPVRLAGRPDFSCAGEDPEVRRARRRSAPRVDGGPGSRGQSDAGGGPAGRRLGPGDASLRQVGLSGAGGQVRYAANAPHQDIGHAARGVQFAPGGGLVQQCLGVVAGLLGFGECGGQGVVLATGAGPRFGEDSVDGLFVAAAFELGQGPAALAHRLHRSGSGLPVGGPQVVGGPTGGSRLLGVVTGGVPA